MRVKKKIGVGLAALAVATCCGFGLGSMQSADATLSATLSQVVYESEYALGETFNVQAAREYEGKGAHPNYIGSDVINGAEEYKMLLQERVQSMHQSYLSVVVPLPKSTARDESKHSS